MDSLSANNKRKNSVDNRGTNLFESYISIFWILKKGFKKNLLKQAYEENSCPRRFFLHLKTHFFFQSTLNSSQRYKENTIAFTTGLVRKHGQRLCSAWEFSLRSFARSTIPAAAISHFQQKWVSVSLFLSIICMQS